jgi:hypothetical protein
LREAVADGTLLRAMQARPEALEGIPFFQTLDDEERAAVSALMKEARFAAGATVFREKDPGGVLREEFLSLRRRRADVALDVVAALARRMRKTDG